MKEFSEKPPMVAKVNGRDMTFPDFLVIGDETRGLLRKGVENVNGCGSTQKQLLAMKVFQYWIQCDLTPCCVIHDIAYGRNVEHSRKNKVRADADLHVNIWRTMKRSGIHPVAANFVSRFIHTTLVVFGSIAYTR